MTGIDYLVLFFAAINPMTYGVGMLIVVEALLFTLAGMKGLLAFSSSGLRRTAGLIFIAYTILAYPLIALLSGHDLMALPQFGLTPCPVTLFTFGLLLLAKPPIPWWLLVVPVLWSVVGGSAAFLLGVVQDWPLLASGIVTIVIMAATRSARPIARPS